MAELPSARRAADDVLQLACRDFVELVTEYLEGTLPPELQRAVAAHLELCDPCVVYLEQVRQTSRLLGELPAPTLPEAAQQRLLDVFSRLHPDHGTEAAG